MDKKLYAWFSEEMYNENKKVFIYSDINNNLIRATTISNSDTEPFKDSNKSTFKNFKCLGTVTSYVRQTNYNVS